MKLGGIVLRVEHFLVILVAILAAAAVLFFSGDTDPLFAIESGAAAGLGAYLISFFGSRGWLKRRR